VQVTRVRTSLFSRALPSGRRLVATPEGLLVAGLVLTLLATTEIVLVSDLAADRSNTGLSTAILLGLGATLPVAAVGTHLVAATGAIASAAFLALLTDGRPTVAGGVALAISLYLLGARHRWPVAALAVLPFAAYAAFAVVDPDTTDGPAVALALVTLGSVGAGRARRLRGQARARDASKQTMTAAFLEYEARGERARIARELHDVVAHHISMIAVQAETARLATPDMPPDGARQLLAIGDTERTALTEMRRLLGVLREDTDTDTTRQPQPGLHQLVELVDDARASAGATTRLVVQGCVTPLDPGIELTVYRIVQEALTNAQARRRRRRRAAGRRGAGRRLPSRGHPPGSRARTGDRRRMSPDLPVRIVVVDDQEVVRAGFAALLGTQADFTVVGTAADGAEALQVCRDRHPDVVLMDVRMPTMDGVEATARLTAEASDGPVPRVVILTTFRPRRPRLRRAQRRCQRLPAQGRDRRTALRRRARRRRRWRPPGTHGHPPADRRVRPSATPAGPRAVP
jgi:signal transduction histidine kinase